MAQNSGAYAVKFYQLIFGLALLAVGVQAVKGAMFGGITNLKMIGALVGAASIVLALDKYYWLLCPIGMVAPISIPGLPFNSMELGCLAVIAVYIVRQALHKENSIKLNRDVLVAFPVFIWICFVWMLNPTGMNILGSDTIGARFYLMIFIGFISLLILSTLRLSEKDCKTLFCSLITALIVASLLRFKFGDDSISSMGEERGSRYELLFALPLYVIMFSRYSLSQILSSVWKLCLVVFLALMVTYSGKRRAFAALFVLPFLRMFFTKKDVMLTFCCVVVGAVMLLFVVSGHGVLYELPRSAQRALGVVVPSFASKTAGGINDEFRRA